MLGPLLDPPKVLSGVGISRCSSKQAIARTGLEPRREVGGGNKNMENTGMKVGLKSSP